MLRYDRKSLRPQWWLTLLTKMLSLELFSEDGRRRTPQHALWIKTHTLSTSQMLWSDKKNRLRPKWVVDLVDEDVALELSQRT
mmetsp:Transcript_20250/g.81482  ORF Transcript_20250/g.81482 Transcript_20250/m.81482 type:complete len:83 (-) Transcript_20250:84-332(-)